jgi:hypothetical protein
MLPRPATQSVPQAAPARDDAVRGALYRTRLLINRTPHLEPKTRSEANRGLDMLEGQLGLNVINAAEASRAIELLNRASPSLLFGLLRDSAFADRFAPALRRLGLRGIEQRLDEVASSVMAEPIPGPTGGRLHRDDLPPDQRVDAEGNPLPPPPGYY